MVAPWREQIDDALYARLVIQHTPSGGCHIIYRCAMIEPNQKLARTVDCNTGEITTAIETRGEGGQILVDPTTGAYHETGRPYLIVQGSLTELPTITMEERGTLIAAAMVLNEYWPEVREYVPGPGDNGDTDPMLPGNDFAAHTDWAEILEPAGWRMIYSRNGRTLWQRPGKEGKGGSAITVEKKTGFADLKSPTQRPLSRTAAMASSTLTRCCTTARIFQQRRASCSARATAGR